MADPITVSVLTHRFEAIVQEMGEAMLRTAYSQILNSSRDFSTALCDHQARLVAQADHVPIHVGAIPWAVESVSQAFEGQTYRRPRHAQPSDERKFGNTLTRSELSAQEHLSEAKHGARRLRRDIGTAHSRVGIDGREGSEGIRRTPQ